MTYTRTSITKILSAVVITCAVAAFYTAPVAAQTATKLNCSGCVKSKQLKNGGVKNKDLKDDAVNGQKIADGTVGNVDLGGDSVTGDKILDGTVTGADVLDESLTGTDVLDESLTGADVQNNSLNSSDVANLTGSDINTNSVPTTDISNEAGMDAKADGEATITSTDSTVIFEFLTVPNAGLVTVIATGTFVRNGTNTTAACSIRSGNNTTVNGGDDTRADISTSTRRIPFTALKTFLQISGTVTYRLNCNINTAGSAIIDDMDMAVMYFPTEY